MNPIFNHLAWSLEVPPPWLIRQVDDYIEISQPEGAGVMRISSTRKEGAVAEADTLASLRQTCPSGTACEKVRCGDFSGHVARYVDWTTSRFWCIWFVARGSDLLQVIYTCWRGEEPLEADEAAALLGALQSRA